MFFVKVCHTLSQAKVSYAVVGGFAVALHGAVRGTVDVDLVFAWSLENLEKAENALKNMGLISRLPLKAKEIFNHRDELIKKRNLIAWNFYNPLNPIEQVDCIINYDLNSASSISIPLPSGDIQILSRQDLINMKKASARPQDLEDIKALEEL